MGARRAHTLHFAAGPDVFFPTHATEDIDVFFYAYGSERREAAICHMVTEPSGALRARFVVGGARLSVDLGRAEFIGPVLPSQIGYWAGRSRLNLNIVRRPHAVYPASSCMRLFELAAMGFCIVSNPIAGSKSGSSRAARSSSRPRRDLWPVCTRISWLTAESAAPSARLRAGACWSSTPIAIERRRS